MVSRLDEFKRTIEEHVLAQQASELVYSDKLNERAQSREDFNKLVANHLAPLPAPDYTNPQMVKGYKERLTLITGDVARGYFSSHLEGILDDIGVKNLAERALITPPTKTGERRHDQGVEIHEDLIRYEALIQKAAKGDYDAVAGEIAEEVEKYVERNLKATNNDPRNRYLKKETIEEIKKFAAYLATVSPNTGLGIMQRIRDELKERHDKLFGDESERASYAKANVRAYSRKGDGEELRAAGIVYNLIQEKKAA